MKTFNFTVKYSRTVYAVIGRDMSDMPSQFPALFSGADKLCLVTDGAAPRSLKARAAALFPPGKAEYFTFALPASEKAKTPDQAWKLCSFLFLKGFSRDSLLIAAGGGAVTDLTGFAASVYMRGINWISAPTTFLAQIDAGLGGKTAVNLRGAKNVVGTFHQPALAVCDTAFLDSLPHAELRSGAGELVKYAMIGPGPLRRAVEKNLSKALAGDESALTTCTAACAAYKIKLVAKDERDETGLRERLNLGHTAGHAFEALAGGRMPHGEAVARGLRFALILSARTGRLPGPAFKKLDALITALRLPSPPELGRDFRKFLALVSMDKKARGAHNRFLLVNAPGRLEAAENVKMALLKKAFDGALK
ncbi:MAG: 3-dehydroquinate synthase [Elusimicrobia bacterium CG08_land_8_20_14_0_20_59_10]|nr:MAG: 3-dehydroquinate synthase [Elusimicrobia bacterium CG08_land_8_20_14_0_20_59_10]